MKQNWLVQTPHTCKFPVCIMTWIVHCKVRKLGRNVHSCIHWTSSLEQGEVQVEEDEGLPTHQIPSYLNEFMWRKRYGESKRMAFNSIMRDVDQQYLYKRGSSQQYVPNRLFLKATTLLIYFSFRTMNTFFQSHAPYKGFWQTKRLVSSEAMKA